MNLLNLATLLVDSLLGAEEEDPREVTRLEALDGGNKWWLSTGCKLYKPRSCHAEWATTYGGIDNSASVYSQMFDKGYVRLQRSYASGGSTRGSHLYYEGYPSPRQLRAIKDLAIEAGLTPVHAKIGGG